MLFEYGGWRKIQDPIGLKNLLINIWSSENREEPSELEDNRYQPFLNFDSESIRANNYIGFIQHNGELIEIYPKVFRGLPAADKNLMLQHIFYWFSYCRKWKFPFSQANLDNREIDTFPELIIYLFANQFFETVSVHPFMQYHPVGETLNTPRGSLNFSRYINRGLSNGNHHQLECDYDPFMFDNKVNRIIKYCSRLLMNQAKYPESQFKLQDVLFILDEVEDSSVTNHDINAIKLNAFYDDYRIIMEMCKTVLNQSLYSHNTYDNSQWCLLFPMEYVFEDFVAGFLERHFNDRWKVEYQKSNAYLATNPDAFQMQHDIFLTSRADKSRKIIVDTKYKLREFANRDRKQGVSQSDLYQVISYAYRRNVSEVILIYPNVSEQIGQSAQFEIHSGREDGEIINVKVVEIPFWSMINFKDLEIGLMYSIEGILN